MGQKNKNALASDGDLNIEKSLEELRKLSEDDIDNLIIRKNSFVDENLLSNNIESTDLITEILYTKLTFYRTNEYKWVRELTQFYEEFFDKEFRQFLNYINFEENEIKQIFLFSLENLYKIVSNDEYYSGEVPIILGRPLLYVGQPLRNKDCSIDKQKIQELFNLVTLPFRLFLVNMSKHYVNYFKAETDKTKMKKDKEQLENHIEGLKDAIKTFRGESENKDRDIEVRNKMIVKLRKGIDEEGGMDKLKSLIDKCYKGNATKPEQQLAFSILDQVANTCRRNDAYKTLSYAKLGKQLRIHHTTAKRWCVLLSIKKYI